jgi:hypothetical protein
MRKAIIATVFAVILGVPFTGMPVWGEEISTEEIVKQMEEAMDLLKKGELSETVKELQFIINDIKSKLANKISGVFPKPPEGWEAKKSESQQMPFAGGGQIITQGYREKEGRGTATATIMLDNPMAQGMAALLRSPALMGSQPNMRRVRIQRENALMKLKSERSGEMSVLLGGGRLMLQIKVRRVPKAKEFMTQFMKSWDFKATKKVAGL